MLTGKQRAELRKQANGISPAFQIGKNNIDEELIKSIDDCLAARELVKIHLLDTSAITAREAADEISEQIHAEVIQVIGRTFVLFKKKKKKPTKKGLKK